LLKGFEHLFRPRAYGNVFGEIHPADYPVRINEKLCRARDIRAFGPCAAMQQIVTPNHFRPRIGEERVGVAKVLSLASVNFRRVHTNRDRLNPA